MYVISYIEIGFINQKERACWHALASPMMSKASTQLSLKLRSNDEEVERKKNRCGPNNTLTKKLQVMETYCHHHQTKHKKTNK